MKLAFYESLSEENFNKNKEHMNALDSDMMKQSLTYMLLNS